MRKKVLKYGIATCLLLLLAYHSVYFKSLSEVKAAGVAEQFDAEAYAQRFLDVELMSSLDKAVEINDLLTLLEKDKEMAFDNHSRALGIGNIGYFLVRGKGTISSINENDMSVQTGAATKKRKIRVATEYIYGNSIRDASGLIELTDFPNTMDLNRLSEEVNKKIRTAVIPPFMARAEAGDSLQFFGAFELNRNYPDPDQIELIPITLTLLEDQQPK